MSANVYNPIPVPVGDGVGVSVSIVGQGLKTFVIGGIFDATVIIEVGIGGQFAPLFILDKAEQFRDVPVVAEDVRVRVVNHRSGQATVVIGGAPVVNTFGNLPVPVGNGVGAALDTSLFGGEKTLLLGGVFDATITYEISEDAAGPFAPIGREDKTANLINISLISRFIRVRVTNYVSGVPIVNVGSAELASGGGGGGSGNIVMFQPGGAATGDNVFNTWADVISALAAIRAAAGGLVPIDLAFDDSIAPVNIPVGPIYDMAGVTWVVGSPANFASIGIDDGVTFSNLRRWSGLLFITSNSTGASPSPISDVGPIDSFLIENGASISIVGGGVPLIDTTAAGAAGFMILTCREAASIGNNPGGGQPVINMALSGQTLLVQANVLSGIHRNSVSGVVGTLLRVQSDGSGIEGVQQNFLGTVDSFVAATGPVANFLPQLPAAPNNAPVGVFSNSDNIRCDVSGGAFVQVLPVLPQSGGFKSTGKIIRVIEESGTVGLTVAGSGANTINGLAAAFPVPAGGSVDFLSDGLSNWYVVNIHDPASATPTSILQWGITSIAAAADTRFISFGFTNMTAPTTPISSWRSPKAMTLRNFRVRHNSAVGNGAVVVYNININGVPQALAINLPTGGIGDASDLLTTIPVAIGDLIDVTATKVASIGSGGIDTTFVCEAF